MIKLTTQQLAEILHGTLYGDGDIAIENVSTDTRQANLQGLFLPYEVNVLTGINI